MGGPSHAATHGETLFELAQWLARVQQYSASHPACAHLGERTHGALTRSLLLESPLTVDVLKDNMSVHDAPIGHAAVRTRLAPHLHERGVQVLRFFSGVSVSELTGLIELLTLSVQSTFDAGGLGSLVVERGLARIQIEEIAHEISADERAAQRTRARLRARFAGAHRDLLARRSTRGLMGDELLELLDHPEMAVTILDEDALGVADALASLCLMVREEERATGADLYPKLRVIILALSPRSHDRALVGVPSLVGEFRAALVWGLDGLDEGELAGIVLASLRTHAADMNVSFYALSVAVAHDGRRASTLRRVALKLYDLPADDVSGAELLMACAASRVGVDSYAHEHGILMMHALRIASTRGALASPSTSQEATGRVVADYVGDQRRVMGEVVTMASRTRRFEQLCKKLPRTALTFTRAGTNESVLGILDGLRSVARPELAELARTTLREVVSPTVAGHLLTDADAMSAEVEGPAFEDLVSTVRLLTAVAPAVVFEHLETSESRKMRRVYLEALAGAGPRLLPLIREKLRSTSWFVVRNALVLLPRVGGNAADLLPVVSHPHEKVRLEVLRTVRAFPPDTQAMDCVAVYLTDPVEEIRQHSVVLLRGELLSVASVARLERVALGEDHPEELRRRVVDALARCPLDDAAAALFTLLQPRGLLELGSLRDAVAVALRRSRAPLAPGYFAEGLRSPAWRVRKACERAAEEVP